MINWTALADLVCAICGSVWHSTANHRKDTPRCNP